MKEKRMTRIRGPVATALFGTVPVQVHAHPGRKTATAT